MHDHGNARPASRGRKTFDRRPEACYIGTQRRVAPCEQGPAVARLKANGTLDNTFGSNGIAAAPVTSGTTLSLYVTRVAIQTDGKIVATGYGGGSSTSDDFTLARFNANGTLDTSFGGGGTLTTSLQGAGADIAYGEAIQSDGKIIVGGFAYRQSPATGYELAMVRYNSDGTLDNTFGASGEVIDTFGSDVSAIFDLLVQPNGKIVAAGQADGVAALFRFNADGSLDTTFGNGGVALGSDQGISGSRNFGEGQAVVQQSSGNYVLGGIAGSPDDFTLERFTGEAPTIAPVVLTAVPTSSTEGATASSQTVATFTDPVGWRGLDAFDHRRRHAERPAGQFFRRQSGSGHRRFQRHHRLGRRHVEHRHGGRRAGRLHRHRFARLLRHGVGHHADHHRRA